MQFGKVENPEDIDFTLPPDAPKTPELLGAHKSDAPFEVYIGCAKWNRTDLKGFYPRGTKDELAYYATQFNSIELNATFYRMPEWQQVETWKKKTPDSFRFFPKVTDVITHYRRLNDVKELIDSFVNAISNFDEKLGMAFLQLPDNFKPKDYDRLEKVLGDFPKGVPLAVEVRNAEWFQKPIIDTYTALLERYNMANIIVDTAGRRDMLHMRLTSPVAFVRYVGANHPSDVTRLNDWVQRIATWREQGLQKLYFFVHQNIELASPLLAEHFIKEMNHSLNLNIPVPLRQPTQQSIFDNL
ncbi:MAG: hypothetical protein CFE23_09280 [Flavobacterium sp. BFFFF1]|uniref:DUF72 domain-containing protein n=1 Tax=Flavobacterium sp. BFFFF1 TaxID=2015557 RepID=UPI000BC57539|nr:DUF72 domain-containing protein [Flavobacterium sp. BFFFF1]OYU80438.1 MAG: hypothetical protein CFE23_09280 [Flavobacterium sp. BFFFF1]